MSKELSDSDKERINREFDSFKNKEYSNDDLQKVLNKENKLRSLFNKKPLRDYADFFHVLMDMIRDYAKGNYKDIPWASIAAAIGTLIYVFSPADFFPDVIPFIGLIDDAFLVGLCLKSISADVDNYKKWKTNQIVLNDVFVEE